MFDPHRQPPPLKIPAEPPSSSEFTVRFSADETKALYLLAARAGVTPQEVAQELATSSPLRELSIMMRDDWVTTYPEDQRGPADMTASQEAWAEDVLYLIGLLKGDALTRYCAKNIVNMGDGSGRT